MKRSIGILVALTFALTAARPSQETTTEISDEAETEKQFKENALSNADGEHPLFSGYEEGYPNYQQLAEYGQQGTGYGGHGPEAVGVTGDVLKPANNAGWNGGGLSSQVFPEESQEPYNLLPPTHQQALAPLFQNHESSPPFPPQQGFPFYPQEEAPTFPATPETSPFFENATPLVAPTLQGNQTLQENQSSPDSLIGSLWQLLNNSQKGNATAGGAGSGAVQNGSATGSGTGVANVGFGGFGIGLGIGGAIQTPLGNLAFGQGSGVAVGR